jgi:hypothetical protein
MTPPAVADEAVSARKVAGGIDLQRLDHGRPEGQARLDPLIDVTVAVFDEAGVEPGETRPLHLRAWAALEPGHPRRALMLPGGDEDGVVAVGGCDADGGLARTAGGEELGEAGGLDEQVAVYDEEGLFQVPRREGDALQRRGLGVARVAHEDHVRTDGAHAVDDLVLEETDDDADLRHLAQ